MSDGAESLSFYEQFYVAGYCDMAAFALIFFEYAVTFEKEAALVWGRKFNGATALFLLNRYLALLKYPLYIVDTLQVSDQGCVVSVTLGQVLEVLPYFVWISFSVLRVYAICGQNWRAALLVAFPGVFPLASNIYLYSQSSPTNYAPPIGCVWTSRIPHPLYSTVILTDVLVLTITWWRTYGIRKAVAEANVKISLSTLLLRDGTIYFLVLLAMNTFHIAFSLTGKFTSTITLEEPLTTILVSRFLLNLREVDSDRGSSSSAAMSYPSFVKHPDELPTGGSLRFASSFIAPLGAPLQHGGAILDEDSECDLGTLSSGAFEVGDELAVALPGASSSSETQSIQEVSV